MGSFSIWHWLLVLIIVLVVFGTKRLRNVGSDLGEAVKGFRNAMKEGEDKADKEQLEKKESGEVIEGEVTHKEQGKS